MEREPLPSAVPGSGERSAVRGLAQATHFELAHGLVWAWIQGIRTRSEWRTLNEVESAHPHVTLVRIQRNLLLHPEAVISIQPLFGGRAKVTVTGGLELKATRSATQRLKEVLGL
jgi:hypothetical protein